MFSKTTYLWQFWRQLTTAGSIPMSCVHGFQPCKRCWDTTYLWHTCGKMIKLIECFWELYQKYIQGSNIVNIVQVDKVWITVLSENWRQSRDHFHSRKTVSRKYNQCFEKVKIREDEKLREEVILSLWLFSVYFPWDFSLQFHSCHESLYCYIMQLLCLNLCSFSSTIVIKWLQLYSECQGMT